jgi:hypothetical protein
MAMHRFVIRENIKHFRKLLETTIDASERARLHELLAEECLKAKAHGGWDRRDVLRGGCALSPANGANHDSHR